MKIKVWLKYEKSDLSPRCRKIRYRECEEHIALTMPEATMGDLRLAFEDTSYEGAGQVYGYKGKFWRLARVRDISASGRAENYTPMENLIYTMDHCSTHFYDSWKREAHGMDTSRAASVKRARADLRRYLLVDGELYIQISEPRYCIYTFGLGHNHGGTALSVDYCYKPNISRERYFSALRGEEAAAEAIRIAIRRGDTESVDSIRPEIKVYAPDLVKVNPRRQHGKGDPFLNALYAITDAAPDALTAGLLCMAATAP